MPKIFQHVERLVGDYQCLVEQAMRIVRNLSTRIDESELQPEIWIS